MRVERNELACFIVNEGQEYVALAKHSQLHGLLQ